MVYVTGLLPVAQGVRAFAILSKEADALINTGDERTKGQIMADLFVERLTGQSQAADVGVTVDVVLSDQTLLGGGNESALLPGLPGGTLPAQIARELIAHALRAETVNWIRTLYTDPAGRLVALSTKQRFVTAGLADYLALRDQGLCRTPWCDAPARQADHITTAAHGGETSDDNTQGLCQACNLAKQAAGWAQRVVGEPGLRRGRHTVETTTPTGHRHRSQAPAPPTPARPGRRRQRRITHELYTRAFDLAIASDYAA